MKNDHEFPFLRIMELFERSLMMIKFGKHFKYNGGQE